MLSVFPFAIVLTLQRDLWEKNVVVGRRLGPQYTQESYDCLVIKVHYNLYQKQCFSLKYDCIKCDKIIFRSSQINSVLNLKLKTSSVQVQIISLNLFKSNVWHFISCIFWPRFPVLQEILFGLCCISISFSATSFIVYHVEIRPWRPQEKKCHAWWCILVPATCSETTTAAGGGGGGGV